MMALVHLDHKRKHFLATVERLNYKWNVEIQEYLEEKYEGRH